MADEPATDSDTAKLNDVSESQSTSDGDGTSINDAPETQNPLPSSENIESIANQASTTDETVTTAANDNEQTMGALFPSCFGDSLPDGILPLFLTGASQEIISCKSDEDVTQKAPAKLIPLATIIADMKERAAVSDFSELKQQLQAYDGEEVLIAYDADFAFGQNFVICVTEAAKAVFIEASTPKAQATTDPTNGSDQAPSLLDPDEEELVPFPVIKKRRGPQPWVSQGSEQEIEDARYTPSTQRMRLIFTRKRRYFGAPRTFADGVVKKDHEYPPSTQYMSIPKGDEVKPLHRCLQDVATQAVPETTCNSSQTAWRKTQNAAVQWLPRSDPAPLPKLAPQPVPISRNASRTRLTSNSTSDYSTRLSRNPSDKQQSADPLAMLIERQFDLMQSAVEDNTMINPYADDFYRLRGKRAVALGRKDEASLKEYQSFKFLEFEKDRLVTCADCHPVESGIVAVGYARRLTFNERVASDTSSLSSRVLIWSLRNPITPVLVLEAPDDIYCLKWHPDNPTVLCGGCFNGQLALWDLKRHKDKLHDDNDALKQNPNPARNDDEPQRAVVYTAASAVDLGHRATVADLHWLPSNITVNHKGEIQGNTSGKALQLLTCSPDGTCLFWDLRNDPKETPELESLGNLHLVWKPYVKVYLSSNRSNGFLTTRVAICQQAVLPEALHKLRQDEEKTAEFLKSQHMFVGTEQGLLARLNWQAPESDSGRLGVQKVEYTLEAHGGAVVALQRCPFMPELLLSVGGDTVHLYKEGRQAPLLTYTHPGKSFAAACWSYQRPAVFFVGRDDGSVDVWDLMDTSYKPSSTQPLCVPSKVTWLSLGHNRRRDAAAKMHQLMVVGSSAGGMHLFDIPTALTAATPTENDALRAFVSREEQRLDAKQELNHQQDQKSIPVPEPTTQEINSKAAFKEYQKREHEFLVALGLTQDDEPK